MSSRRARPRRNPDSGRSALENAIANESAVDILLDGMRVISVPLTIVVISTVVFRDSASDTRVRGVLVNGLMAAAGFALRDTFPRPAFGMIGWGALGTAVGLLDLLIAPNGISASGEVYGPLGPMPAPSLLAPRPSGRVLPSGDSRGYWEQRSSLNSGTSVVVPLG